MQPTAFGRLTPLVLVIALACGPPDVASGGTEDAESESGDELCPELVWDEPNTYSLEIANLEHAQQLPKYTSIRGHLRVVTVVGLTDLRFLGCLREVEGGLAIGANPDLESLAGLERLIEIKPDTDGTQTLSIGDNARLVSLDGLSGLTHVDYVNIGNNPLLESLDGLSSLQSGIWISALGNDSLRTIGLRALEHADTIQFGYGCLDDEAPPVPLGNDGLLEFDGLDSIESYGVLRVSGNENLASIAGMIPVLVGTSGTISLKQNPSLGYAHIQEVAMALGKSFSTCGNLDEPELCDCELMGPP